VDGEEVVRRRIERKEGYIFVISLRTTEHNLTNLTLRVFTMRYYTSVVSLVQIDRDFEHFD
jgi:hypothetical protein